MTDIVQQPELRHPSQEPNLVSSFETGFITVGGIVAGVCIKFRLYAGGDRVSHWALDRLDQLMFCLKAYGDQHWIGSDMLRTVDEPNYVSTLPKRHPYHTVVNEQPKLTQDEIGSSSASSFVRDFEFVDRGKACDIRYVFRDNSTRVDVLPEYVAMNLWGYLQKSLEGIALMASTAGSA